MNKPIKLKSPIDNIIVDLIMDHFNAQAFAGQHEVLTSHDFESICDMAEAIYFKEVVIKEKPALA